MEPRIIDVAKRLEKHHRLGSDLEAELVNLMNTIELPAGYMAQKIGISPQYFSDIKKGRRPVSQILVKRIASLPVKPPVGLTS